MQNNNAAANGGNVSARLCGNDDLTSAVKNRGQWRVVCRGKNGKIKWEDEIKCNIVLDEGLDYLLDVGLSGGAQIAAWSLGLTDSTPTVIASDTMASHPGWVEVTAYDELTRLAWVDGGVSAQSVSNAASVATFTVNANGTVIGGAFLTSVNTKGGATGAIYAAGAFVLGDKTLNAGETLDVTATFSQAAV